MNSLKWVLIKQTKNIACVQTSAKWAMTCIQKKFSPLRQVFKMKCRNVCSEH